MNLKDRLAKMDEIPPDGRSASLVDNTPCPACGSFDRRARTFTDDQRSVTVAFCDLCGDHEEVG